MKEESKRMVKEGVKKIQQDDPFLLMDEYEKRFGETPWVPVPETPYNPDYIKMVKEALDRGTPLTDEDYDKYFPIEPGIVY